MASEQPSAGPSSASNGNHQSRSKSGSKRNRESSPSPTCSSKCSRGPMPSSAAKKRREQHHLKLTDVKAEDEKLKAPQFQLAFYTHLRMMWASFQTNVIPELPTLDMITAFERGRYTSPEQLDILMATLETAYASIVGGAVKAVDRMREVASRTRSLIASNVLAMDQHFLRVTYSAIISSGLAKWRPDALRNFGSMYNQVHELIAIKTFQTITVVFAYSRVSPNLTNLDNMQLLQRFYRNYVFWYIGRLAKKEMKLAGSVKKSIADMNTYKRRKELAVERTAFLQQEGYRSRVISLSNEPECHSDDEPGFDALGKPAYLIHAKPGPDGARARIKAATKRPGQLIHDCPRVVVDGAPASAISERFPGYVPLDWFEPNYFNALPAALRATYKNTEIALPLPEDLHNAEAKTMKKNVFMKKYGYKVKAQYNLPSEELRQMENEGDSSSEDDEEEMESIRRGNPTPRLPRRLPSRKLAEVTSPNIKYGGVPSRLDKSHPRRSERGPGQSADQSAPDKGFFSQAAISTPQRGQKI
ncbi:hypothetical protein DFH09DRAFT_1078722 [Mycena vulgaris]|nr:hypothetical protein DFH09DRAFT_1078722 [Mycena vulgaris]